MPRLPIDSSAFKRYKSNCGDASRLRRFSADESKRAWYAKQRTIRFSRFLSGGKI